MEKSVLHVLWAIEIVYDRSVIRLGCCMFSVLRSAILVDSSNVSIVTSCMISVSKKVQGLESDEELFRIMRKEVRSRYRRKL